MKPPSKGARWRAAGAGEVVTALRVSQLPHGTPLDTSRPQLASGPPACVLPGRGTLSADGTGRGHAGSLALDNDPTEED